MHVAPGNPGTASFAVNHDVSPTDLPAVVGLAATSRGRLLLRIIAMCFDRYLATTADAATPRYSRTV